MGTHPIFESDFDCLTECLVGVATVLIDIARARTIRDIREGRKNVPDLGHRSKESTISNGNPILNAMTHMMNTEGAILQAQGHDSSAKRGRSEGVRIVTHRIVRRVVSVKRKKMAKCQQKMTTVSLTLGARPS